MAGVSELNHWALELVRPCKHGTHLALASVSSGFAVVVAAAALADVGKRTRGHFLCDDNGLHGSPRTQFVVHHWGVRFDCPCVCVTVNGNVHGN